MNIEDVIKACGPLPQAPQSMPSGSKKINGIIIGISLSVIAIVGYLYYRELQRKKDLNKVKYDVK
jgi:hypothetical protein